MPFWEGGFGESRITVLEHLGGTLERHIQGIANVVRKLEETGAMAYTIIVAASKPGNCHEAAIGQASIEPSM